MRVCFVQLKLAVAAADMQRVLAERQRDDALAQLAELQDQLQEIDAEIEGHMHEAEQERRRSQIEVGNEEEQHVAQLGLSRVVEGITSLLYS